MPNPQGACTASSTRHRGKVREAHWKFLQHGSRAFFTWDISNMLPGQGIGSFI